MRFLTTLSLKRGCASRRLLLLLLLALPAWLAAPAVHAQQGRNELNQFSRGAGGISIEQASATARRETGGRVLQVKPVSRGGQRGYSVRVLIDGKRVKQYYVDSQGRISPQ
jgi:hypothetical protein